MPIWEKLAAAELLVAGPVAALLGTRAAAEGINRKQTQTPDNEVAFTVGVIALAAKMAKADGVVTKDEVKAFKNAFKVSDAEMKQGARVFNLAKQNVAGYEDCAEQLVVVFKGNRKMLEDVLEGLFHIAKADAALHPREEEFLGEVAKRFGLSDAEFGQVKARHVVESQRDPYEVLGLEPSVSDEQLKNHYRALLAENRPDDLIARGVPAEFIAIAIEKVAAFTEAYKEIARQRGI
ncbi:MAG TPA: TerB family tellurite resistance protein [Methyloceanibacter sp.]|jgi:DnaJ like chaperone protein|nr:TerB family tellurite resistance protein [Methyloceanibacter sp.]